MLTTHTLWTLREANLRLLEQAHSLLKDLNALVYSQVSVPPHRPGGHMRHILEFYDCFLDGLPSGRIDYDRRKRSRALETDPAAAIARIAEIRRRLIAIGSDDPLLVRPEDAADPEAWMFSSVTRELQVLRSHTIHHYALMSLALQACGVPMDPEFGMAPSTLRHKAEACAR